MSIYNHSLNYVHLFLKMSNASFYNDVAYDHVYFRANMRRWSKVRLLLGVVDMSLAQLYFNRCRVIRETFIMIFRPTPVQIINKQGKDLYLPDMDDQ